MTKRENVLEKCRINLDSEKVKHSITRIERDKYKARIDKAIKYIEEHYNYENFMYLSDEDTDKLLEILKGSE